jgi:hypothetical protein
VSDQFREEKTKDLHSPAHSPAVQNELTVVQNHQPGGHAEPPTRVEPLIDRSGVASEGGGKPRLPWPARDRRLVDQSEAGRGSQQHIPHTEIYRGEDGKSKSSKAVDVDRGTDPVVGWLVVVDGPGKGRAVEIGVGANSIGREPTQKLLLNFGDMQIHREKHAFIIYEPNSRAFFLQGGDARNLTYVDKKVVLTPVQLQGGETIMLGQTHLRFVPLCGPDFSWV